MTKTSAAAKVTDMATPAEAPGIVLVVDDSRMNRLVLQRSLETQGHTVLQGMKSDPELRAIPVVVISAIEEQDAAVRCIELGAEDVLAKPFNPVILRARVRASLARKRLHDLEQEYLAALTAAKAAAEQ